MRNRAAEAGYAESILSRSSRIESSIKALAIMYLMGKKPRAVVMAVALSCVEEYRRWLSSNGYPTEYAYALALMLVALMARADRERIAMERSRKALGEAYERAGKRKPRLDSPSDVAKAGKEAYRTLPEDAWIGQKADVFYGYGDELWKAIGDIGGADAKTDSGISVWAKCEIDVRQAHQREMVDSLIADGKLLCWVSAHANCSERCQRWQGRLFHLTEASKGPGFRVGQVDGNDVYSFRDVTSQVDRYGYRNNVIVGFNCRHRLIPYVQGRPGPALFPDKAVDKSREAERRQRAMERAIRKMRGKALAFREAGMRKEASRLEAKAREMVERLRAYCKASALPFEPYRVKVR